MSQSAGQSLGRIYGSNSAQWTFTTGTGDERPSLICKTFHKYLYQSCPCSCLMNCSQVITLHPSFIYIAGKEVLGLLRDGTFVPISGMFFFRFSSSNTVSLAVVAQNN